MAGRITLGLSGSTPRPLPPASYSYARLAAISNMSKRAALATHLNDHLPKLTNLPLPSSCPPDRCSNPPIISHPQLPSQPGASSSYGPTINCQPPKRRKPYACSDKHNAHNRQQKEAAAAKLKQWQDAHKMKTKRCYVCKETKSLSEFYRVRTHASGRCVACKNSPGYQEAYKKHCEERPWLFNGSWRKNADI